MPNSQAAAEDANVSAGMRAISSRYAKPGSIKKPITFTTYALVSVFTRARAKEKLRRGLQEEVGLTLTLTREHLPQP